MKLKLKSNNAKHMKAMPKLVELGNGFMLECFEYKPKRAGKPTRYWFSVKTRVPSKYRMYSCLSFPGTVKAQFVEIRP